MSALKYKEDLINVFMSGFVMPAFAGMTRENNSELAQFLLVGCMEVIPQNRCRKGKRMSLIKTNLSPLDRSIAIMLAAIFMAGGLAAVVAGMLKRQWSLMLVGLVSIWWSSVWMWVSYKGHRLDTRELLWPFRRS